MLRLYLPAYAGGIILLSSLFSSQVSLSNASAPGNAGENEVTVNSKVTIDTTIHNPYQYPVSYFAIYVVLNSTGFTSSVEQTKGQLPRGGNDTAQVSWIPDRAGSYQISTFIVNALDVPELLMSGSPAIVNAIDGTSGSAALTDTIPLYGSIAMPATNIDDNSGNLSNAVPLPTQEQLRQYALAKINQDRANYTAPSVKLSSNAAAQAQADEMLTTKFLSHWSLDGMKPYMRYSVMGGKGYVAQNVAGGPLTGYSGLCNTGTSTCPMTADVLYRLIDQSEFNLVNNDGDCCANMHRDNLLDPFHTDVSIGIAYDNSSFYMVQNFENNYIAYDGGAITTDNKTITISGKALSGWLSQVLIYYDDLPSNQIYLQNRDQVTYDPGEFVGGVVQDASKYNGGLTINATQWQPGPQLKLSFDMSPIMMRPGVYTIYVFFDDNHSHRFVVTSYSVFHH